MTDSQGVEYDLDGAPLRPNSSTRSGIIHKIHRLIKTELGYFHPRLWLVQILLAPLPIHVGSRLRAKLLSLAGFEIGAGTVMWGTPRITGRGDLFKQLHIGRNCWFNIDCFFDLGDSITIGDRVSLGHQVMLLTSTHQIGNAARRSGPLMTKPIQIGNGVWVGARTTILPGVTIHDGAVVGVGAVVTKDVLPNTIVGGIPAQIIRRLED